MTRDEWPKYICCVLTVRDELIRENRPLVQQLVNHVLGAGLWLDQTQANRTKGIQIAARPQYFNQDPNVLKFVMENPADRVTYGDLRLIRAEFEEMVQLAIAAGMFKRQARYEKYVDESFVKAIKAIPVTL
jgi:NitT/TauT family transport system substrate-binding protein